MTPFINYSELYNAGGQFARQEVIETSEGPATVTTVYGGYAPRTEPNDATAALPSWTIRRLIVTDYGQRQEIECTWAVGSWDDRATLEYNYYRP